MQYAEQGLCNGRASVRPSVRLSVPSIDSSSGVQRVCCWATSGLEIAIDSRRRRSAANAGSIVLTTEERSWPRSCYERVKICLRCAVCLQANVADDEAAWTKQSPPNVWMQCVRDVAPCVNIYGVNNLTQSWWRGTVVERRSLAGELSLSCTRPAADGWPLMWVSHPL